MVHPTQFHDDATQSDGFGDWNKLTAVKTNTLERTGMNVAVASVIMATMCGPRMGARARQHTMTRGTTHRHTAGATQCVCDQRTWSNAHARNDCNFYYCSEAQQLRFKVFAKYTQRQAPHLACNLIVKRYRSSKSFKGQISEEILYTMAETGLIRQLTNLLGSLVYKSNYIFECPIDI